MLYLLYNIFYRVVAQFYKIVLLQFKNKPNKILFTLTIQCPRGVHATYH